ncbi:hypothetical protein ROHU_025934 [Labeo rohita]|uniref:Uncharacterized protein n=1 Tax=Labeo rohita TaxID=84645 RepID=A0A498MCT3_LABRO|nr:hypothetical protein ROHU_025934 [Labeo rohita]
MTHYVMTQLSECARMLWATWGGSEAMAFGGTGIGDAVKREYCGFVWRRELKEAVGGAVFGSACGQALAWAASPELVGAGGGAVNGGQSGRALAWAASPELAGAGGGAVNGGQCGQALAWSASPELTGAGGGAVCDSQCDQALA